MDQFSPYVGYRRIPEDRITHPRRCGAKLCSFRAGSLQGKEGCHIRCSGGIYAHVQVRNSQQWKEVLSSSFPPLHEFQFTRAALTVMIPVLLVVIMFSLSLSLSLSLSVAFMFMHTHHKKKLLWCRCSMKHLPGFVDAAEDLKGKGVDAVACVSVNDAFVMDAWGKQVGTDNKVMMLADGSASFTKSIGCELDLQDKGMGVRSRRYSMLVDDGVVKVLNLEEGGAFTVSSADDILKAL